MKNKRPYTTKEFYSKYGSNSTLTFRNKEGANKVPIKFNPFTPIEWYVIYMLQMEFSDLKDTDDVLNKMFKYYEVLNESTDSWEDFGISE